MAVFKVTYKDKATNLKHTMNVDGNDIKDAEGAKKHVESLPNSRGGTHAGLEVISAEEVKSNEVLNEAAHNERVD